MELRIKPYAKIAAALILTILSLEIGVGLYAQTLNFKTDTITQESVNSTPISAQSRKNYGLQKFGYHIEGPDYIQRRANQTTDTQIQFQAYSNIWNLDYNTFDYYILRIGDLTTTPTYFYSDAFYVEISPYLRQIGVFNLTIDVHHRNLNFFVTKSILLNVTQGINFVTCYPNMICNQYDNYYNQFSIKITKNQSGSYLYKVFVNETLNMTGTESSSYEVYWDLDKLGIKNKLGKYMVRFEAYDQDDNSSTQYNMTIDVITSNNPEIMYMQMNCNSEFRIGISDNREITTKFYHPDNKKLSAAYLIDSNNQKIVQEFKNITTNVEYKFKVNPFLILPENSSIQTSNYYQSSYLQFVVVDEYGKRGQYSSQGFSINRPFSNNYEQSTAKYQMIDITTSLTSFSFNFSESNWDNFVFNDLTYRITIAAKSKETQKLLLIMGTGTQMERKGFYLIPNNNDYYNSILYRQEYKDENYGYTNNYLSGIIFSINVQDSDLITWPIKVKIEYPEWLAPNTEYEEASLKLFRIKSECNNYNNYNFEMIPEENVTSSGVRTVLVNIYQPGYYMYGKYAEEYEMNQQNGIDGYHIFEIIGLMGISFAILIRKIQKRK